MKMKNGIRILIGFHKKKENQDELDNVFILQDSNCQKTLSLCHHPFNICTYNYILMTLTI